MRTVSSLTVRAADAADAPAISELLSQLGYPTPPPLVAARLAALSAGGQTRVLVAGAGAGVTGFLALTRLDILPYPEPLARITALCVEEIHRRAGVGGALEERAAEIARGWGCEKLEVTSNRRRVGAHVFYLRHGYEETHRCFIKRLRIEEQGGLEHAHR
ncbi:MAG: GNAT family N-acetyltransferase [Candidatus Methylomirabilia bacterium]